MARYLNPKNDVPFKRIFGEHPDLLKSFLNALMPFAPGQLIESLEYIPTELVPENPAKRNSIVDVRCTDNYQRQFIVEMQMFWSNVFTNRMVFNASKAYVRQLDKTQGYELLQPVYGLGIINDYITPKNEQSSFYHHYQTINKGNTDEVIRGLEFVLIELPKFKPEKVIDRKMAVLWLRFLNELEGESNTLISDDLMENQDIRKALDLCEEGAFTAEELAAYEKYWDIIRTEIATTNVNRAEGEAIGMAKGEAIGIAKGEAIGVEKGRVEGEVIGFEKGEVVGEKKKALSIAAKALKKGMSVEDVMELTGLTREEIEKLLNT